ncbi:radical SAM protein [Adlercreutzia sp. R7]|uniref:Radical SAM protein n=1 Tax=Adlercreutzia wanghongyangiae TaxID=3111451 RepID=A0ABU6IK73_9ACTN|nr:radical SAM protein [Adlercreutzia sp. R7]
MTVNDIACTRPTLAAWLAEYEAIAADYVESLRAAGIDFAPKHVDAAERAALKERLARKGARFRNGDASISTGPLSTACEACATDDGSRTFYLSLACNRNCYFCFNANQADYEEGRRLKENWRCELDAFLEGDVPVTHVALTGGEPLLHPDEAVAFLARAHARAPQAHLRLYTDGDFLTEALLARLRDAGLTELRLSVKPDEEDAAEEALRRMTLTKRYIPQVMVEMPVIPGTLNEMKKLLQAMDDLGVFGINLLEFGYPMGNWEPFADRGFRIANPPFAIPYNYRYAGGLPVASSELACLKLVEFALDEGLSLGVHYCSLENKNRTQIFQQNSAVALDDALWEFDRDDFFWKTAKVFDGDMTVAEPLLREAGAPWARDPDEPSIQFHPRHLPLLAGTPVMPALSVNVVEQHGGAPAVRELALTLVAD